MSDLVIRDGSGNGNRAKVDDQNRVHTLSTVVFGPQGAANSGFQFSVALEAQDLNSINTEHVLLWAMNTDPDRHFHLNRVAVSWNGGSTSWNRPAMARLYVNTGTPSANHSSVTPANLGGTTRMAQMTAYKWDGVGNGMTASAGTEVLSGWISQGFSEVVLEGGVILRPTSIVAMSAESPEIGSVTAFLSGWYEKEENDLIA